jgi:hypothetical protein
VDECVMNQLPKGGWFASEWNKIPADQKWFVDSSF